MAHGDVHAIRDARKVKACTGEIAEQSGKSIPGQYLPGGGKQAMIDPPERIITELNAAGERVMRSGVPEVFERNGIHGYAKMPGPGKVQTARVGAREYATKDETSAAGGAH